MASLEKPRKLEDTVGKMRTLRGGTVGKRRKKAEHSGKHIEKIQAPKLNGERRPLRFGARQLASG